MNERIRVEKSILSENDKLASAARRQFLDRSVVVLNLVSSPGAGKTSLLEKTLQALRTEIRIGLIAGDVQTENDAERLLKAGGESVWPLVTGGACHLDARMVNTVLDGVDLGKLDLLFIENVGNLVCPSSFDLGELMKVVLISTAEGDDKPLKYPAMFRRSGLMVVNKTDLLGMSDFSMQRVIDNARSINPDLEVIETSCRTGAGLEVWFAWLKRLLSPVEL
ncbi:MAG TPA: hydrogenase nickel incorporation protein HypB [Acidobacteriota bacterium]|nr:hydrogenase nickel incorporation protein HypB [Acidobacteriota bacterium]